MLFSLSGMGDGNTEYLSSVEVLDLLTKQWSMAAATPLPLTFMSTAVCEVTNRVYLLGG